jgi:hypothetical protein
MVEALLSTAGFNQERGVLYASDFSWQGPGRPFRKIRWRVQLCTQGLQAAHDTDHEKRLELKIVDTDPDRAAEGAVFDFLEQRAHPLSVYMFEEASSFEIEVGPGVWLQVDLAVLDADMKKAARGFLYHLKTACQASLTYVLLLRAVLIVDRNCRNRS